MNKATSLVVGLVVIAIAVFAVLSLGQRQLPSSMNTSQIAVATSTITASTTEYTVDAQYPQFGIPTIDTQVASTVQSAASDLESQAMQDQPAENNYPLYNFSSIFENTYLGSDYVSAEIVLSDYTGGAHENPVIYGATFDRATGQPVTLDQALALTGMTLEQVASSSKAQLAQNPDTQPTGMWASGSDPTPDNYSTFLINKTDVVFIFQPYQVGPFSSGAPQVVIPRIK